MSSSLSIDLNKLAKFTNFAIPLFAVLFFAAGYYVSFYFHYLTVSFLFLSIINFFYLHVQTRHALLRNFGILGQARYMLESVGPELRQYLFASDTEERPFNREERTDVYRKAKNIESTFSFGTLTNFDATEIKFKHSLFPLDKDQLTPFSLTFGAERGLSSAYTIHKHILISAMSYGALGKNAVRALARGAKMSGIPMNTGEGGFPKYHLKENTDLIFQLGTAKFGVRHEDGTLNDNKLADISQLEQVRMIEIKLSQGAKPGKGGMLPKEKISEEIAELRGIPRDRDAISPSSHKECKDLASTVAFLRRVQEVSQLPVGMKLCIGCLDEFRELIREMKRQGTFPDYFALDGGEGGTGAAPKAFMDHVGLPILPALHGVQTILLEEKVRDKTKILSAGKLINPGEQLVAMALGADAVYTARGFLLALGCIQALQCGKNTCPAGITTHDPALSKGLVINSKAERVAHYTNALERELLELLAASGCPSFQDLSPKNLFIPAGSILAPLSAATPQAPVIS